LGWWNSKPLIKGIVMNELEWFLVNPLEGEAQIKKFEDIARINFPDDFVNCIKKNNAGYPLFKNFETLTGDNHICNNLLTFDEKKKVNIFNVYRNVFSIRETTPLVPFAEDPFGNYICFDFSESTAKIIFWHHETNKTEKVCDTFTEFLAKLDQ